MVHLTNTSEITIVKRTPELTVEGKCLSVKIIYYMFPKTICILFEYC